MNKSFENLSKHLVRLISLQKFEVMHIDLVKYATSSIGDDGNCRPTTFWKIRLSDFTDDIVKYDFWEDYND